MSDDEKIAWLVVCAYYVKKKSVVELDIVFI